MSEFSDRKIRTCVSKLVEVKDKSNHLAVGLMIIPLLLTLAVVAVVVVHADSNLRGHDIVGRAENFVGNQHVALSAQDELIKSVIDQMINNDPANGSPEARASARSSLGGNIADLLNYDGGNPELSYQGFLVSKLHSHEDCSGPGD